MDDVETTFWSCNRHARHYLSHYFFRKPSSSFEKEIFKDSNVDPEDFDGMDYAQKRLLVLKSSKAIINEGDDDSDFDDHEPAILALQNSSQWGSMR